MLNHRYALGGLALLVAAASACSNDATSSSSDADSGGSAAPGPRPTFGPTVTQASPPPPVSGGTLIVARDGHTAVAADPDRDVVYVVDLITTAVSTIALAPGDEPGRVAEDANGRVHVALRSGGALATIDLASRALVARRDVCVAPRGVAYDPADDGVYVACASGELVELPAAGGPPTRTAELGRDLRDVVVEGDRLLVSRFRSAEVLHVSKASWPSVFETDRPPASDEGATPSVAWRMVGLSNAPGVMMLHQRGRNQAPVKTSPGGYSAGGTNGCDRAIVEAAVSSFGTPFGPSTSAALSDAVLPVDAAISPTGKIAVVAAGNANTPALPQLLVFDAAVLPSVGATLGPPPQQPPQAPPPTSGCAPPADNGVAQPQGQATAVAYDADGFLVVQTREPATLFRPDFGVTIPLSGVSRRDTGHDVFHSNAGGFIACASCHAEGGDDGRVWDFDGVGPRRTPSLRGTVAGTAPYHWGGEMKDFPALVHEVFTTRMSGADLGADDVTALSTWVGEIPAPPAPPPSDPAAAARGEALFDGPAGCSGCHAGVRRTNNATVDVGTGGRFQVPPLVGVGYRAPFLHAGCAATLRDRFTCGGTQHGNTSGLDAGQIDDLVAFLGTL